MSFKGKKKSRLYSSKEGYNLHAKYYDKKLSFLDSFEKDVVHRMLGNLQGKKVLDLGCGTGRLIKVLADGGANVTACDNSEEMVRIAKKKFPEVEILEADVGNLPFENDSFDFAVATFMIVHLKRLDIFFDEVYRILKDGGHFLLTNINQRKPPKVASDVGEFVIQSYYHRPEDVVKSLEKSMFFIEKEEFVKENNVWVNQVIKARK